MIHRNGAAVNLIFYNLAKGGVGSGVQSGMQNRCGDGSGSHGYFFFSVSGRYSKISPGWHSRWAQVWDVLTVEAEDGAEFLGVTVGLELEFGELRQEDPVLKCGGQHVVGDLPQLGESFCEREGSLAHGENIIIELVLKITPNDHSTILSITLSSLSISFSSVLNNALRCF